MGTKSLEVGPPTLAVLSVTNRRVVASGVRRATIEASAGISHNRLAVILRGDRPMTVDELVRICEAIGVSAAAVLREAEEMLSTAPPALPADVDPWALAAQAREGITEDDANV